MLALAHDVSDPRHHPDHNATTQEDIIDWQTLRGAELAVQLHLAFAIMATALGAMVLWQRKGGRAHRWGGRAWVALAAATALSSFAIHAIGTFGPFSPLHALSALVLVALWQSVRAARRGEMAYHRSVMRTTYLGAFCMTGLFALLPGRLLSVTFFGPPGEGWWVRNGWLAPFAFGMLLLIAPLVRTMVQGIAKLRRAIGRQT